jgi:hypothetical protein
VPSVEELDKEIAELGEKLQAATALRDAMRAYEAVSGRVVKKTGNVVIARRLGQSPMSGTQQVAKELMETTNAPVATADVLNEMLKRGMAIPIGPNAQNIISARLSNSPLFKGRRGHGYWFADRPWPGDETDLLEDMEPSREEEGID